MPRLNDDEWRSWVVYARRDRVEAHNAVERGSWSEACFHAQQSCEKLLKALLIKEGVFMPVHDLGRLAEEASSRVVELVELVESLGKLTVHYYASRYPDAATRFSITYDEGVARMCVEVMDELWRVLGRHLA
ncbi:HEPN domain-containing protein [Infirmifilum lucidum]|uniref:HEPN domain-containing protein n=1 Tax=Infirmifilum lucidum TaxID=2776706 RepID=A0A7L9FI23_9CREN|nr:HEPN domain-containing protein [Infirmifilum lucidum]